MTTDEYDPTPLRPAPPNIHELVDRRIATARFITMFDDERSRASPGPSTVYGTMWRNRGSDVSCGEHRTKHPMRWLHSGHRCSVIDEVTLIRSGSLHVRRVRPNRHGR